MNPNVLCEKGAVSKNPGFFSRFIKDANVDLAEVSQKGGFRDAPKMQEWLGHTNIATAQLYDRRQSRPEESPTFKGGILNGLKKKCVSHNFSHPPHRFRYETVQRLVDPQPQQSSLPV